MKRFFSGLTATMVLTFCIFTFTGCEKESIKTKHKETISTTEGVSVVNNLKKSRSSISNYSWLHFETVSSYSSTLQILQNLDDNSLYNYSFGDTYFSMLQILGEDSMENIGIEDDLLAKILNPDGVIQIEDYVFKVDCPNETVYVYMIESAVNNGDSTNVSFINTYSIDDDVIDLLFGESDGNNGSNVDSTSYAQKSNDQVLDRTEIYTCPATNYVVKCKLLYQRAGIYHSLLAKIKKAAISWPAVDIYYDAQSGTYKRNGAGTSNISAYSDGGNGNKYKYRPYSGRKKLTKFNWSSDFEIYNVAVGSGTTKTYHLHIYRN